MKSFLRLLSTLLLVVFFVSSGTTNGVAHAQDSQDSHVEQLKKEMVLKFMEDHPELNSKFFDLLLVMNGLKENYVDSKSYEEYLDLALKGMAEGLDPYSTVFIGKEAEQYMDSMKEQVHAGVGMTIAKFGKEIYVVSVVSGSPAEKAGLEPGDIILKVITKDGDQILYGLNTEQVVSFIRGPENTEVALEIRARRYQKPRIVKIIRKKITYPSVESKQLANQIGYIKISSFERETPERFLGLLKGMSRNKGLIIDLRGNPGGLLDSVTQILGYFIGPDKTIVTERRMIEKGVMEEGVVVTSTAKEYYPPRVVVLIDNFSASASEIMAGNMKYYKVATLMGVRTFGKALVQDTFDADISEHDPDKSKLLVKVTIARYFLPDGQDIQGSGVQPDIEVEQAENFRAYNRGTKKDLQLQQAIKFLRK